jgi:lipopolysaccharide/colanic/teichoic acid biosynthesis glycosyltransferase
MSPLLLVAAASTKLYDGGPVLYRARRIGKDGKPFDLLKFRSMVVNADKIGAPLTSKNDSRVTPIGRILRKTKIDELPQLWNVIRGEMNLVGARPEDPRYVALYTPDQSRILAFRPGITSPASVLYRNEEKLINSEDSYTWYISELLPRKLAVDLEYLERQSFLGDLGVIAATMKALLKG